MQQEGRHGRWLGILVDHLVDAPRKGRIAASVRSPHVLVVGHLYVDIWQAIQPVAVAIDRSDVPLGTPWKQGVCATLGWPSATAAEIATAWRQIRGTVRSYADPESALLGRVEGSSTSSRLVATESQSVRIAGTPRRPEHLLDRVQGLALPRGHGHASSRALDATPHLRRKPSNHAGTQLSPAPEYDRARNTCFDDKDRCHYRDDK